MLAHITIVYNIINMVFCKGVQVKFSQPLYSTLESDGILYGSLVLSEPLQNIYRLRLKFISGNATSKCKGNYCRFIATFFNSQEMKIFMADQLMLSLVLEQL